MYIYNCCFGLDYHFHLRAEWYIDSLPLIQFVSVQTTLLRTDPSQRRCNVNVNKIKNIDWFQYRYPRAVVRAGIRKTWTSRTTSNVVSIVMSKGRVSINTCLFQFELCFSWSKNGIYWLFCINKNYTSQSFLYGSIKSVILKWFVFRMFIHYREWKGGWNWCYIN